jgi:formylglycine-generating enzyme required for sulfatase activity
LKVDLKMNRNLCCGRVGVVVLIAASMLGRIAGGAEPAKTEPLKIANTEASGVKEMKPYTELLEHTSVKIDMVPIPGGVFAMGSPANEQGRQDDEGPVRKVNVDPFWMAKCEITWNAYDTWGEGIDQLRRQLLMLEASPRDSGADAVTRPTPPYTDMSFTMGKGKYPAICMTQHAARTYCKWLSKKTGRYYRLPTEAEWEFACRGGTTTPYSFGKNAEHVDDYAWYSGNSDGQYHKVGLKKPNQFGLHDMHGNASEWVLDQYAENAYEELVGKAAENPLRVPTTLFPRVVRGGGWDDVSEDLRSARRNASDEAWKDQDPQIPQSIWYHTDALSVGLRIVRPLHQPSEKEKEEKWEKTAPVQLDPEE